jgi:hypothetical protein
LKNIEQENLNSHTAYFLVKNCLFVPRLIFLLRTSPFWKFPNCIKSIGIAIRNSLQKFLNIKFNENQWTLASLPISNGGLGSGVDSFLLWGGPRTFALSFWFSM